MTSCLHARRARTAGAEWMESVVEKSEGLAGIGWANYPLDCRARFLVLTGKAQTASLGVKRHFIYPQVDEILDAFLLWEQIVSSPPPSVD